MKCGTRVIGLNSVPGRATCVNAFAPSVRETAAVMKLLRRGAVAGLLAGVALVVWRKLAARTPQTDGMTFAPAPFPSPPRPVPRVAVPEPAGAGSPDPTPDPTAASNWVEPDDGACPISHPVKAKIASGIFHVPGGLSYERTRADRCYVDASSAESDGLRPAKR